MYALFTSYVCDICDPPVGVVVDTTDPRWWQLFWPNKHGEPQLVGPYSKPQNVDMFDWSDVVVFVSAERPKAYVTKTVFYGDPVTPGDEVPLLVGDHWKSMYDAGFEMPLRTPAGWTGRFVFFRRRYP